MTILDELAQHIEQRINMNREQCDKPMREVAVRSAISALEKCAEQANEAFVQLAQRLEPVLRQEITAEKTAEKAVCNKPLSDYNYNCKLAVELAGIEERLHRLFFAMNELQDRLEI